ncbi:MAG: branched-chain amino acid ABC transporter, ATP-binding protein LivG [Pseudolabrys sp.]|jgi:branched-chain amino acid transport system ATP-binding protein|nr:branched-chain amino acid ABC transporter, ATP-binding protein LivG [Pseudolabrys sp.]
MVTAAKNGAALTLSGVHKNFGGIRALSDVSITVPEGRIVGVIGPNGAGKTTLFNVITGAFHADSGSIVTAEQIITRWPPHRIARAGIARTFQNIRLFSSMTVWEHLLVAQPRQGASLRNLMPIRWANPEAARRAEDALSFFGLEPYRTAIARTLPYGIQRKVEMARALTSDPKLLLLDEPVAGMNYDEAEDLRALLVGLNQRGLSILLIEHDMTFVMSLCHEIYVLDFGAVIAEGSPNKVRNDPVVLDAYLGAEGAC